MKNKPLVGISDNYGEEGWHNLKVEYVSALAAAGALPVIVPFSLDADVLGATLRHRRRAIATRFPSRSALLKRV